MPRLRTSRTEPALTADEHTVADDVFTTLREVFETAIGEIISEHENIDDPSFLRALAAGVKTAGCLGEERLTEMIEDERAERRVLDIRRREANRVHD